MDGPGISTCSSALLAAQKKLNSLQKQHLATLRKGWVEPVGCDLSAISNRPAPDFPLTARLGWGSAPLTQAIIKVRERQIAKRRLAANLSNNCPSSLLSPVTATANLPRLLDPAALEAHFDVGQVKIYPDIALAILKRALATAGRAWILLRHLDPSGRGWLPLDLVREQLTEKGKPLRLCGRRQLRKVLARGNNLFWSQANDRIWLRSPLKVAAALGLRRLSGHPVTLPVETLLQGIGLFRAHLYATFHSGRAKGEKGDLQAQPISRSVLKNISGVSRQAQRNYERRTGVGCHTNYAIGSYSAIDEDQNRAWKQGRALFKFTDHRGALGRQAAIYTAWQLPNHYIGPHSQRPKGRQKRINRELADLFMKGMTGNSEHPVASDQHRCRRFYRTGSSAAVAYNRASGRDLYWRSHLSKGLCKGRKFQIWHCLPGLEQPTLGRAQPTR